MKSGHHGAGPLKKKPLRLDKSPGGTASPQMSEPNGSKSPSRVLIVDDDEQACELVGRALDRAGYDWESAGGAEEAQERLQNNGFALMLSDVRMRGEAGIRLIEDTVAGHPDIAVVMMTGSDEPEFAKTALDFGVYGYIIKPFTPNEVVLAITNALRRRQLEIDNRAQRHTLEQIVKARTDTLERSARQLKLTREETVRRLSRAVEYRDEETGQHTERMSRYCAILAVRSGLDPESIRIASAMHDVGKVAVPDQVLLKPGILTPEERREMERHTEVGYQILHGSGSSLLELGATIAWTHHEKYDGSGYPRRLVGQEIPMEGRVAAVADVFDALTTERSYRKAFRLEDAIELMRAERGRHFDPYLLDFFLDSLETVLEIRRDYADEPLVA
jgi:putative two-component system response regulator